MDQLSEKDKLKEALAWLRDMSAHSPTDASPTSAARIYHIDNLTPYGMRGIVRRREALRLA